MSSNECKPFYGAVTVSDRGQIVIPAEARRDLNIEIGEKLLVVGGPSGGLLLIRASLVGQIVSQWSDMVRLLEEAAEDDGSV
ncbi:MAG: AbrB/MazE/SpoVT family DNA-binding domain-containing protein [Anaerolineae bacterium]|nr:AbrB/MazE/SpoVT family DNA-binding domain-containing protein [Anaerolineae bacterium]